MAWSRLIALVVTVLVFAACGGEDVKQPGPPGEERKRATEQLTKPEEERTSGRVGMTASMTGPAEAPRPGDPDGAGAANLSIDTATSQLCYKITVDKIAPPTQAHIHEGEPGRAGPVVIPLQPAVTGPQERCFGADGATLQRIVSNPQGFYVNVHNAEFPDGAIRGQLQGQY
ncbi:MAG: CHRD domain-containing protein [Nitriliruptorales bacterium]